VVSTRACSKDMAQLCPSTCRMATLACVPAFGGESLAGRREDVSVKGEPGGAARYDRREMASRVAR
jgi:hypothetical protein